MEAVLAAAEELRAPLIVQTSVKTVKSIGADVLFAMWTEMTRPLTVPVALHLDHCPERDVISLCLDKGWNSVLFDGSKLSVEDNKRQTIEVVAEARLRRACRGRDRGLQAGRGDGRRRARQRAGARDRGRLRSLHRGRHLRPGDRQRPWHVQDDPEARQPAGHRHRRGDRQAGRPAWRDRHDPRSVQRPDRARLRQGQHLDGAQDRVHPVGLRLRLRPPGRVRPAEAVRCPAGGGRRHGQGAHRPVRRRGRAW